MFKYLILIVFSAIAFIDVCHAGNSHESMATSSREFISPEDFQAIKIDLENIKKKVFDKPTDARNMLQSSEFITNTISSSFGTIVGAILAFFFAKRQFNVKKELETRQKQIEIGISFHKEMTSCEFSLARAEANKIFEEHKDNNNLDDFYQSLDEDRKKYIRIVMAYFRRLHVAVEYNQIDKDMVLDLLSGEFIWWYVTWLKKMTPQKWETRKNIEKLNDWLQKNMRKDDYENIKKSVLKKR